MNDLYSKPFVSRRQRAAWACFFAIALGFALAGILVRYLI